MKSRINDFLAIKDRDLQSYIYSRKRAVYDEQIAYKIENDEKIAYYCKTDGVARNTAGAFYKKSKLEEWIVYNKLTKKAKVSNKLNNLRSHFLNDYFRADTYQIISKLIGKLSATLCKKIVEGKIQTLGDLVAYHRSYTIRRKNVPLDSILRFMVTDREQWLHLIEDPENIETMKQLSDITSNSNISSCMPFKFKVQDTDINKLEEKYEKWIIEQGRKYAALERSRDENAGSTYGQATVVEASSTAY